MSDPGDIGAKSVELIPQAHGGALRRGGPGRPKGQAEAQQKLRDALFASGPDDQLGILDVLIAGARKGDTRKIELCLWYGIGKPTETVDLTLRVREAASRLAQELGIDDSLVQSQVESLLGGKRG
jgi:hypothetical protein